ncbi:hypothetical protein Tco_1303948 [Tanacetum coccineum]
MPKVGSFGEETDKTTDLHQHLSRLCSQQLETASQITRDAVTIHTKMTSQDLKTTTRIHHLNNHPVLPAALRAQIDQELHELYVISAFVDSCLESIEQFLNNFLNQPNETNMNNLEFDDEAVDAPFVSPFPHSDNDLDDDEVLNELIEYENTRTLRQERIINSFDGDDLAFEFMIGFRKFTAYLDLFYQ